MVNGYTNDGNANLLTVREMSRKLHVHPNTLRRWGKEGRIREYRINKRGDRRYYEKEAERVLETYSSKK